MKLTLQRKIYLGVLLLAAVAFAADRWLFTPKSAGASPTTTADAPVPHTVKKIQPSISLANGETLADFSELSTRLKDAVAAAHTDPENPVDAFHPSAAWLERTAARTRKPLPSPAEQFRTQHHLKAVMAGDQAGWAIVDGKTITIGQSIDHFRLVKIRDRSATFESADIYVELQMAK